MTPQAAIHATAVARHGSGGWVGALLRGPSGAGKSDLALRLMATGWRLVSDDYSHVWRSGGDLYATAPAAIAGRIEVRGMGLVAAPTRRVARVGLVVDCTRETVARMPDPERTEVGQVSLPRLTLDVRPASAVEILILAMGRL